MELLYKGYQDYFQDVQILDTINVSVAESFVMHNKFSWSSGNGESRLYIGSQKEVEDFFSSDFICNSTALEAIVTKNDLRLYLYSAEPEYENPQSSYRNEETLQDRFAKYNEQINDLEEIELFYIKPHNGINDSSRFYIGGYANSSISDTTQDEIYKLLRKICLPQISRISIVKIKDTSRDKILYWFRPYIHEYTMLNAPQTTTEVEKQINNDTNITEKEKYHLIKSRVGQGKFREECFTKYNSICVIFGTDQREVLQACHIKPWVDSDNCDRLNVNNSILLTADFHRLFDLGFICFDEKFKLKFSTFVTSKMKEHIKSLIVDKDFSDLKGAESFLEYHRINIFRD